MRKLIALFGLAGLMLSAAPSSQAHMGKHDFTATAGTPCAFACPYWLENANTDIDGEEPDEIHFEACEAPEPWAEGTTYDDIISEAIPDNTDLIILELFPLVDFDGFICERGDTWDGDGTPSEQLASTANILGENCDNVIGPNNPVPFGCREKGQIAAGKSKWGKRVVFRIYNWSDGATTPGRYEFKNV